MINSLLILIVPAISNSPHAHEDDFPVLALNAKQRAALIADLDNSSIHNRIKAASRIGSEKLKSAVPHLISRLKDANPMVRGEVIKALGELKVKSAAISIYRLLLHDPSPLVRANSAIALGKMEYRDAIPAIIPLLDRPDIRERLAAIEALGKLGGPKAFRLLTGKLSSPSYEVRAAALKALAGLKDKKAVFYLRKYFETGHPQLKRAALNALVKLNPSFLKDKLKPLLAAKEDDLRLAVLDAIGEVGCDSCQEEIIALIKNGNDRISVKAASVAAYLNLRNAISDVISRLRLNPATRARMGYLWACARLGGMDCVKDSLYFLESSVPEQRLLALRALRILRPAFADLKNRVYHLIHDSNLNVASEAIELLSEYGDRRFSKDRKLVETKSIILTGALARSLRWTAEYNEPFVANISRWLMSDNTRVKENGVFAAAFVKNKNHTGRLLSLLYTQDTNLKIQVLSALAMLDIPWAGPALEYVLKKETDDRVAALVWLALSRINWSPSFEVRLITAASEAGKNHDDYINFIYAAALMASRKTEHRTAFNQAFQRIFFHGRNSADKEFLIDLLNVFGKRTASMLHQKIVSSELHRVRVHAMRYLARFMDYTPEVSLNNNTSKPNNNKAAAKENNLKLPFDNQKDDSRGCSCRNAQSSNDLTPFGVLLITIFAAISISRRRFRK